MRSLIESDLKNEFTNKYEYLRHSATATIRVDTNGLVTVLKVNTSDSLVKEVIRKKLSMITGWTPAMNNGAQKECTFFFPVLNPDVQFGSKYKNYKIGAEELQKGNLQTAISFFDKVLERDETDYAAYYNRGVCYFKMQDTTKACRDWKSAYLNGYTIVLNAMKSYCNGNNLLPDILQNQDSVLDGEKIYRTVEEKPVFPGEERMLFEYLHKSIRYPKDDRERGITGKVYVTFVIDKEGFVRDPKILKGVSLTLDAEAIRVVSEMPKWKPGRQDGNAVNVLYNLPITFNIINSIAK